MLGWAIGIKKGGWYFEKNSNYGNLGKCELVLPSAKVPAD
jgi:hypothetical protein